MCLACSFPATGGHWSGAGTAPGAKPDDTLALLRTLLAPKALTVTRLAPGAGFLITTPSGRGARAATLDDVWPTVEQLAGHATEAFLSLPPRPSDGV